VRLPVHGGSVRRASAVSKITPSGDGVSTASDDNCQCR
jgi:hypothetical protein